MTEAERAADNAALYEQLLAAYSIPGEDRATWLADMGDLFDGEPYATVEAALRRYRKTVKPGPKEYVRVPTPEAFSDWVQLVKDEAEREAQKALPPPAPPRGGWDAKSGAERVAFFERHVALGKLRARAGKTDLNVPFEATEAEIAGVIGEMRARRFLHGTFERIAARDGAPLADIGAQLTGRWPGAEHA